VFHEWVVVALGLGAAFAFALSSSLKHVSAGHHPDAQSMHPGKLRHFVGAMLSHPLWLGGIGCDVVGLGFQIVALHLGRLTVVQPLLVSGLLFALVLRQLHEHHHITRRQMGWAIVLSASLIGFVILASEGGSSPKVDHVDRWPAAVVGACGVVLAGVCVEVGRRQRDGGRSAALLGIAVGTIYAALAALLKAVTDIVAKSPLHLFVSWQLYVVLLVGALGLLLNQLAFQAGPITASLPATATVDPLLSVIVGVVVYDERINPGPGGGVALALLVILLGLAVIQLARTQDIAEEATGTPGDPG
jgi:drug/metabolite transporter (DMT)-like permease